MLRDYHELGWSCKPTLDFFVAVWEISQTLPPDEKLRIRLVDMQRPWEKIQKREDWQRYRVNRDSLMAENILDDLRTKKDKRNGFFIVGMGHAMEELHFPEGTPRPSAGWHLKQALGDQLFTVFQHTPVATDRGVISGRLALGLIDSAFAKLGGRPVAFTLQQGPFGKLPFDGMSDRDVYGTFSDGYDAYLYLIPLEDEILSPLIEGFYSDEFMPEIGRRCRLMRGEPLFPDIDLPTTKRVTNMRAAYWGQPRSWIPHLGPENAWHYGDDWQKTTADAARKRHLNATREELIEELDKIYRGIKEIDPEKYSWRSWEMTFDFNYLAMDNWREMYQWWCGVTKEHPLESVAYGQLSRNEAGLPQIEVTATLQGGITFSKIFTFKYLTYPQRWQGVFYCAFREGRGHVSTDGRIRILVSKDADTWTSAALISLEGYDLRDAHLSVTPDDRLMLLGGAAPREKDNQSAPTGTFVSFSTDGRQWTEPQIAVQPGRWLWCVTWNKDKAYGISYTAGKGDRYLDLLVSDDGIYYEPHVPRLFEQGYPTEVTLRFDSKETCYALVRRDRRGDDPSSALLGVSRPDYKQWQWKDLGAEFNGFGGPNLIKIPGGFWLAAGRIHEGGAHTAITYLDVEKGAMTKLAKLPSGGDTSYPGMVWHNNMNMLYVSYYSSHESKTSIYLAKVKIRPIGLCKIAGVVSDEKGKRIAGVKVQRLHGPGPVNTDAKGKYELVWDPVRNRPLVDTYYIIARHERENLSVVAKVPEFKLGTETVNLNLLPGVIFKGRVVNPAGRAIKLARVDILLHTPTQGSGFYDTFTDSEGIFEFRGIPTGHEYSFAAKASGHGIKWVHDIYAGHDFAKKDYNLEPITLAIADQSVSGLVVDANDKPMSGVLLRTDGKGQPQYNIRTDAEGKFTIDEVCAGAIRIFATVRGETLLRGYAGTYGGATNVRIVVAEKLSPDGRRFVPKSPPSLVGKILPSLENLNLRFDLDQLKEKMILVCFWDMQQRPSRNCIIRLAEQVDELKQKGVAVVAIQSSKVDKNTLDEWVKKYNIPFPVGMIQDDEEKTRFAWGIKSQPWLIMTDRKHIVTAEGFALAELDETLKQIEEK